MICELTSPTAFVPPTIDVISRPRPALRFEVAVGESGILPRPVRLFCDLELRLSGIGTGTSRSHLLRNLGPISHRKQSRKSWEIDLRDPDSCLLNTTTATSPTFPVDALQRIVCKQLHRTHRNEFVSHTHSAPGPHICPSSEQDQARRSNSEWTSGFHY